MKVALYIKTTKKEKGVKERQNFLRIKSILYFKEHLHSSYLQADSIDVCSEEHRSNL